MSTSNNVVPVYHKDGTQLDNTTTSKARKLLKGGIAKKQWINGVFSIQLLEDTRKERGK